MRRVPGQVLLLLALARAGPALAGDVAQTDWSGGPYSSDDWPLPSEWGSCFASCESIDWSDTGSLTLASGGTRTVVEDEEYLSGVSLCLGDIDGDGDLDIVRGNIRSNSVAWLENRGTGSWVQHTLPFRVFVPSGLVAIDLDLDGDCDVSVISREDGLVWLEQTAPDEWSSHVIDWDIYYPRSLYCCDADLDGDPDLLTGSSLPGSGFIAWWENRLGEPEDGSPWKRHIISDRIEGYWTGILCMTDEDQSGHGCLLCYTASEGIACSRLSPDGAVTEDLRGLTSAPDSVADHLSRISALCDVDSDGKLDICCNESISYYISHLVVWLDDSKVIVDGEWAPRGLICRDMDGDGDPDLVGCSQSRGLAWWENMESGRRWIGHHLEGPDRGQFAVGDIDGDGRPDLVTVGSTEGINIWELGGYSALGTLSSGVLGIPGCPVWRSLSWSAATPAGTTVRVDVCSGRTSNPQDDDWVSFSSSPADLEGIMPEGLRELRYRVTLETTDPSVTPTLREVRFNWE